MQKLCPEEQAAFINGLSTLKHKANNMEFDVKKRTKSYKIGKNMNQFQNNT